MTTPELTEADIERLRDASDWVQRLSRAKEDAQALTDEWMRWCQSNPLNLAAFEQMQRVWDGFGLVGSIGTTSKTNTRPGTRLALVALAACMALVIAGAIWLVSRASDAREIATAIAMQRSMVLADGTQVDLAPDSVLSTHFSPVRRDVELERGQAFFAVTHSPMRPFTVHAGNLTVTASGTAFDVRIGPTKTVVTVSEGHVAVAPTAGPSNGTGVSRGQSVHVGAGERVTLFKAAQRPSVSAADPSVAESWREGTLEFVGESLGEVVGTVNRYSSAPIAVAPELQQIRFTGTVSPNHVQEWLKALEQIYAVRVVDRGVQGTLVRSRAAETLRE